MPTPQALHQQAGGGVQPVQAQQGRPGDAGHRGEVRAQVGGVVRPVAGDGDRPRALEHPGLDRDQADGQDHRKGHDGQGPTAGLDRLGFQQTGDGLAANQGGRGEHQAALHQAGEGFGLAVAEAVLGVRRRDGVADRVEGDQRGQQVEAGIGQRRQQGHRAAGPPGEALGGDQHHSDRHRQGGHPAGQDGGLGLGKGRCAHAAFLAASPVGPQRE